MKTMDVKTRISIKNIAFVTDLSPASYTALPFAEEFARCYRAKVWGFHVLSPSIYSGLPPLDSPEARRQITDQFKEHLQGVPNEVVLSRGETWNALSTFIAENNVDLVVLSTHGRTGVSRALLGSVAETIFRQCPCPVLTVGPMAGTHLDQPAETEEILYATDFTPESRKAAPYAMSIAQEHQARLVLLHVIEPPKAGELTLGQGFANAATELLHEIVSPDAQWWCKPEFLVERGTPAENILNVAQLRHAHLIVLGLRKTQGGLGLATHFAPATAHKVVSEANCPVLTVRG